MKVYEARKQLSMLFMCQRMAAALYDDARVYVSMSGLRGCTVYIMTRCLGLMLSSDGFCTSDRLRTRQVVGFDHSEIGG